MKNAKCKIREGFTLVELIVSLSITAIIMVGISMFFASSFKNVSDAQQKLEGTQGHFVINDIIQDKFANLQKVWEIGTSSDYVVFQNKVEEGILSFTYIGLNGAGGDKYLVFKDFFVFKGIYEDKPSTNFTAVKNPAGITKISSTYYVVAPLENAIYSCSDESNCDPFITSELKQPIGITTDGTNLYIADAGNNRIVKITVATSVITPVSENLNFPVGIDYYENGADKYLFFSEPYKNKVYRVKTDGSDLKVVVGEGDDYTCNNSALYCKLDFPTGVFADDATHSLYIADTGKNRVLKVSDPGYPTNISVKFSSPATDEEIKKIIFTFPTNTNVASATLSGANNIDSHGELDLLTPGSITYKLWTLLSEGTNDTNDCITYTAPPSPTCTDWAKIKIKVNNTDLFDDLTYNKVNIGSDVLNPITINNDDEGGGIFSTSGFSVGYGAGNEVTLMTPVSANTDITFNFSNLNTSSVAGGFQDISAEMYNEGDISLGTKSDSVRIGNGILGTPEDKIEVLAGTYTYPTGISSTTGAPPNLHVGENADFISTGATFDYTTDFTIDENGLTFSKPNSGAILQAIIKAGGQEYIINGAILSEP